VHVAYASEETCIVLGVFELHGALLVWRYQRHATVNIAEQPALCCRIDAVAKLGKALV
jgi:hypothetical protein